MPNNLYELSRQFLKLCSSDTHKIKLLSDQNFPRIVTDLITSDQEEILIPALLGLKKLTCDSSTCHLLRNNDNIMKYLNNLSKKYLGNDQLKPMICEILDILSKKDSGLNSSVFSKKMHQRVQGFSQNKSINRPREFNTFKYSIFVPGLNFNSTRKQVEKLLVKIKGVKSFQIDPNKEMIDLYTRNNFRLSFVAKVFSAHAQIDDIYWLRSENGMDQKTKVTYEDNDLESSRFSVEDFSMVNDRVLVNQTTTEQVSWTSAIGNFFAKTFYW